jgi:hypothetical protein
MRGFGKEFVFLKFIVDNNNLFVFSIYLNYHEENIIQQIKQIYYANKGNKKVDFVLKKNKACIYLDGELHSQSFINIGSDVPPKFIISFPNGLTGRGNWDIISGMFR